MERSDIESWNATDPAWIARVGAIPETYTEGDGSLFPDGTRATQCSNWARYARRAHGSRAKIFGFYCEDNPDAVDMARLADGHDFALLDGRYILDGWLCNVEGEISDPILDLQNPDHAILITCYYGDRENWSRMTGIEVEIDQEEIAKFQVAMHDVSPVTCAPAEAEMMEP
ncbi:hypothetical protein KUV57_11265 [Epibacterium sp. DP7N7-1]|nr:hypothetical protein [Epibacterium sp. DP7N7-1]